jgi:DNA-binding FadR family transcriptional regulator
MSTSDRRESRTERAARVIGTAIVRGDHAPGATLPIEAALARALRVSRNSVREAVKALAAKGLLRTNRRGGTVVLPMSQWNLLDPQVLAWALAGDAQHAIVLAELAQLAGMILPQIAALAARDATTAQMLRLLETCEAMERANDPAHARDAQIAFLEHLFAAARNRIAGSLVQPLAALWRAGAAMHRSDAAYRAIAEAVRQRDPDAARDATVQMLGGAGMLGETSAPRVRVRAGRREMPAG